MDMELTAIHMVQDFSELAEEYEGAASNERLWAKGSDTFEAAAMHEENAEHCAMMAKMYRNMAKHPETILKLFVED
jgi:hypothetical protein